MTAVSRIVRAYLGPPATAGSARAEGMDRAFLQRELRRVAAQNLVTFGICVVMLCALFALSIWLVVANRGEPAKIQATLSATGVTLLGVVTAMVKLWGRKVKSDLLLAMAGGMSEESLKATLASLIKAL